MAKNGGLSTVAVQKIAAQDRELRILRAQLHFVADLAGVRNQLEQIRRQADLANPASPVPDPPEEAAPETTEQALAPDAMGDASRPGAEPQSLTRVPAEANTTALTPGVEIQTPPASNLVSVTAPVQGTNPAQDGGVPVEQRRIETDVRIDPNPLKAEGPGIGGAGNNGSAFPWLLDAGQQKAASVSPEDARSLRTFASMRLGKLRMQAGLAHGDELSIGAQIERDARLSTHDIEHEIAVLSQVAQRQPAAPPMRRTASRPAPSLAPQQMPQHFASAASSSYGDDLGDLFID